jgi:pyridoxal/pyridoxine/pyridoxamine kinase
MVGDSWRADICMAVDSGIEAISVKNYYPDAVLPCPNFPELEILLGNTHHEQ